MNRLLWIAAFAALLPALAEGAEVCVAPAGETGGSKECADGTFASFETALAAGQNLPLGDGEELNVRLLGGPESAPVVETLSIDTRGTPLTNLAFELNKRPLCPAPETPPGDPVVEIVTTDYVFVRGLAIDLSSEGPCPGEHPGILTWGTDGRVLLTETELVGWTGWGVTSGLLGEPVDLTMTWSSIRRGTGTALHVSGPIALNHVEFVSNALPGNLIAEGLVWVEPSSWKQELRDLVFFGNHVAAGPTDRGLFSGPFEQARNLVIVANGLGDGVAAVRAGYHPWYHAPETEPKPGANVGLFDSVIARNRHVTLTEAPELPDWPDSTLLTTPDESQPARCLDEGGTPLSDRPSPFVGLGVDASGPLVSIDPGLGYPDDGGFLFARTFVVENENNAPLVEARLASGLSLQLIHNTFDPPAGTAVMRLRAASSGSELVLVRNLLGASGREVAPLSLDESPGRLHVSMNGVVDGPGWTTGLPDGDTSLLGPDLPPTAVSYLDEAVVRDADGCMQLERACPGVDMTCNEWQQAVGAVPCAVDAAARWVPDDDAAAWLSWGWPWGTSFFPDAVDGAQVLGATGWQCAVARGTLDGEPPAGDGDGFPDAFDCDNLDASVVPRLPVDNGVDTLDCDPAGGECWTCTTREAEPPPAPKAPTGCAGCGYSWDPVEEPLLGSLLLLAVPLRRRHRP